MNNNLQHVWLAAKPCSSLSCKPHLERLSAASFAHIVHESHRCSALFVCDAVVCWQAQKAAYCEAGGLQTGLHLPADFITKCFPAAVQQQLPQQVQVHMTVDGADNTTVAGGHHA
jgi:hypothetical protein